MKNCRHQFRKARRNGKIPRNAQFITTHKGIENLHGFITREEINKLSKMPQENQLHC